MYAIYGKFGQVPHVVFDRCDLSAEIKWTYTALCRELWASNGAYSGSYSKLGEQLRITKNKAYRMVKALEQAHLLTIDGNTDTLSITLNPDLWLLNGLHEIGMDVPYWKDVHLALGSVLKIERQGKTITSLALESVLKLAQVGLNLDQTVLFLERFGLNLERFVLFLERLKSGFKALEKPTEKPISEAPIIYNNNISTDRQIASQKGETALTADEQKVHDLYCQLWFIANPPKVTEKIKGQWALLAPHIKTKEDMESLEELTRRELKARGIDTKIIHPGNLTGHLNSWIQTKGPKLTLLKPNYRDIMPPRVPSREEMRREIV